MEAAGDGDRKLCVCVRACVCVCVMWVERHNKYNRGRKERGAVNQKIT